MTQPLYNRVALITGANHGIGAATARACAAAGANVFLTYRGDPAIEPVLHDIHGLGVRVEAWEADLGDPRAIPHLFERIEATLGPVDVLVNNAAVGAPPADTFIPQGTATQDWASRPIVTVTAASHDWHFAVNSRAVALMMAEFARRHIARGAAWGRIINLSTDGAPGFPGEVSYGASKAALESYSRAAAGELGRAGITVNVVAPGPIQTGWITPELEPQVAATIPLGRVGQPDDVADVIVFLATDQARWLTGQTLYVGGGHRMV